MNSKQLVLGLDVRLTPSTDCQHFWSLYWTSWGRPKKQCIRCGWDDELDIPKDHQLIRHKIKAMPKDENTNGKIELLNHLLDMHGFGRETVLGVSVENTPSTDIKEGSRGYYQGQPCTIERVLKNGRLKIVTSDLERHTITPEDFRLQLELPLEETVLGVSVENTPSTESNTPSTNRRPYRTGGGYVQKRTLQRKGKVFVQYFFIWEENGKQRSRYIARNLETEIINMNERKCPVREIIAKLGTPKCKQ